MSLDELNSPQSFLGDVVIETGRRPALGID
jgi:hypothetical protein